MDKILFVDSVIQDRIDTDFESIEKNGHYILYRNKVSKAYWRLDQSDKLQQRCFVKLDTLEGWEEFDDKELRIELLKYSRGTGKEKCLWSECQRAALRGIVYCERHAYEEMGIRR